MTDYTKSTNFTSKDSLSAGDPLKIVRGSEFDTEFNAIATAVATKADLASGTLTTPTLVGATMSGNLALGSNQITTTGFKIYESGGKLIIAYGSTPVLSISSAGVVTSTGVITGVGTP